MSKSALVTLTVPRDVAEMAAESLKHGIEQLQREAKTKDALFALGYMRAIRDNLLEQLNGESQ